MHEENYHHDLYMTLIQCRVRGVFMTIKDPGAAPTVVLTVGEEEYIPIYIGLWEAISIYNALKGEISPRPITHDLFVDLMEKYSVSLEALQIDQLDDGIFYSRMIFLRNGQEEIVDCRPSDGIAIALRADSPVLVDDSVVSLAAVPNEDLGELKDISVIL
jgi:bifunctional DNase/RNase